MTRTNFVIFVVTALVLCVLLGVKASLRHAALAPTPAVTVPKATTVVPVKPAPAASSQPMSTSRIRPESAPSAPRIGGKGSPDGR